jgi:hypothetical protein
MPTVLGVDPGMSGALAVYCPEARRVLAMRDMPVFDLTINGKKARALDYAALAEWVHQMYSLNDIGGACIEEVHTMPKQGAVTQGRMMEAYGAVRAVVASIQVPVVMARPVHWKRVMGCSSDKDSSRQQATLLLPSDAYLWTRKGDHGRAEATLLAVYGWGILNQKGLGK